MFAKLSVLLADGEPEFQKWAQKIIKPLRPKIRCVTDGPTCRAYLGAHDIDVAIINTALPDMSGLEILSDAQDKGLETLFIMVSNESGCLSVKDCLRNGAYDSLEKPSLEPEVMRQSVLRALEKAWFQAERRRMLEFMVCEYGNISPQEFRDLNNTKRAELISLVLGIVKLKMANREGELKKVG